MDVRKKHSNFGKTFQNVKLFLNGLMRFHIPEKLSIFVRFCAHA